MTQTPLFANIAKLSALNVFTFLSSCFTVVSVPFKIIVPKTNQLTCHSFTEDLYILFTHHAADDSSDRRTIQYISGYCVGSSVGGVTLRYSRVAVCVFQLKYLHSKLGIVVQQDIDPEHMSLKDPFRTDYCD